jgi:hypothetical protein
MNAGLSYSQETSELRLQRTQRFESSCIATFSNIRQLFSVHIENQVYSEISDLQSQKLPRKNLSADGCLALHQ